MRRIEKAADHLGVLGLKRRELERLPQAACRKAVMESYRKLCRLVHPDKCPSELREQAAGLAQRARIPASGRGAVGSVEPVSGERSAV